MIKLISINALNRVIGLIFNLCVSVFFARQIGPDGIGPFVISLSVVSLLVLITDQGYSSTLVINPSIKDLSVFFSFLRTTVVIFFLTASLLFLVTKNHFIYFTLIKWLLDLMYLVVSAFIMGRNDYKLLLKMNVYSYAFSAFIIFVFNSIYTSEVAYSIALLLPMFLSIILCYINVEIIRKVSIKKVSLMIVKDRSIWLHDITSGITGVADRLILSLFFPLGSVSLFDRAKQIIRMPIANLSLIVQPVILSTWSEKQGVKFSWRYLLALFISAAVFKLISKDLYIKIFGNEWAEGADYFVALVTLLPFSVILAVTPGLYKKMGKSKVLMILGILNLSVVILPFSIGGIFNYSLVQAVYWYVNLYFIYFLGCMWVLKRIGILSNSQLIGLVFMSVSFYLILSWI